MSTKKFSITTNVSPEIEAYLEGHFPVKHEDFRDDETPQRPVRRVHRRDSEFRRIAKREARERYLMVKDIKSRHFDLSISTSFLLQKQFPHLLANSANIATAVSFLPYFYQPAKLPPYTHRYHST